MNTENTAQPLQERLASLRAGGECPDCRALGGHTRGCPQFEAHVAALQRQEDERLLAAAVATRDGYITTFAAEARDTGRCPVCAALAAQQPAASTPRLPQNAADVRAFIGPHFSALNWGNPPDDTPHEDDLYRLSAHDLLSAFRDWQDMADEQAAAVEHRPESLGDNSLDAKQAELSTTPQPAASGEQAARERIADLQALGLEMLAALRAARGFIRNGVDLGFIRMPDADTPDPAHQALPMIEAAIARATGPAGTTGGAQQ